MVTLKELKELDANATSSPWEHSRHCETAIYAENDRGICSTGGYTDNRIDSCKLSEENLSNAQLISATRNALPDLIRVIESAEEALSYIDNNGYVAVGGMEIVKNTLSEIRKLKGE